jgi:hypothetical protein
LVCLTAGAIELLRDRHASRISFGAHSFGFVSLLRCVFNFITVYLTGCFITSKNPKNYFSRYPPSGAFSIMLLRLVRYDIVLLMAVYSSLSFSGLGQPWLI